MLLPCVLDVGRARCEWKRAQWTIRRRHFILSAIRHGVQQRKAKTVSWRACLLGRDVTFMNSGAPDKFRFVGSSFTFAVDMMLERDLGEAKKAAL